MEDGRLRDLLGSPLDDEAPRRRPAWAGPALAVALVAAVAIPVLAWLGGSDGSAAVTSTTVAVAGGTSLPGGATTVAPGATTVETTPSPPTTSPVAFRPDTAGGAAVLATSTGSVVVVGGFEPSETVRPVEPPGLTWVFDPAEQEWEDVSPAESPPGRHGHALAYDTASDRVVLFGGGTGLMRFCMPGGFCAAPEQNDTWAYDPVANTWEEMSPGLSPSPRFGATAVYAPGADVVVLFGGRVAGEGLRGIVLGDTWVYDVDGDQWREVTPAASPPARSFAGATYDPFGDRVLMWSGQMAGEVDGSVWAFDPVGETWEELAVTEPPPPREFASFTYDETARVVVAYGGEGTVIEEIADGVTTTRVAIFDETWLFDPAAASWRSGAPGPAPAVRHQAVFDAAIGRVVVIDFSGTWAYDVAAETWAVLDEGLDHQ